MTKHGFLLTASAFAGLVALPAQAAITPFASFSPVGSAANVLFSNATNTLCSGTNNSCGGVAVKFNFLSAPLVALGDIAAVYTLSMTSADTAQSAGSTRNEDGFYGSFSLVSSQSFSFNGTSYSAGTNLLTGVVSPGVGEGAGLSGRNNGTTATFGASTADPAAITYTSALLNFSNTVERDFQGGIVSVTPAFGVGPNGVFKNFAGTANSLFSSDPAPLFAVPEPAIWAMMLVGFGAIGGALRNRRRSLVVTFG